MLGLGNGGADVSSGELESSSSVIVWPCRSLEGPSTVTSGLARELDEPSNECWEISAIRRLEGEADLPPRPFVQILLTLAWGACLTVVPARFSNNCCARLGCELFRLGKVADIGTLGIGATSCPPNVCSIPGDSSVPVVNSGLNASGVSGNSWVTTTSSSVVGVPASEI